MEWNLFTWIFSVCAGLITGAATMAWYFSKQMTKIESDLEYIKCELRKLHEDQTKMLTRNEHSLIRDSMNKDINSLFAFYREQNEDIKEIKDMIYNIKTQLKNGN